MKSVEEVMPVLKKLYREKLNKNPDEIIHLKTEGYNYIVSTGNNSVTIMRRPIDLYIDNQEKDFVAEAEIVAKLKTL